MKPSEVIAKRHSGGSSYTEYVMDTVQIRKAEYAELQSTVDDQEERIIRLRRELTNAITSSVIPTIGIHES